MVNMLARLFQSSGSKSLIRWTLLTTSRRAFITLTSDKNVGLIDESFHKDILRNQEDLSISKTYKDGVLFYSWHLKDIEKYKEVQEMFADEFSKSVKPSTSSPSPHDPNCVYSHSGLFIERERTASEEWLYKPGYIENNEKVLITREWMERWLLSLLSDNSFSKSSTSSNGSNSGDGKKTSAMDICMSTYDKEPHEVREMTKELLGVVDTEESGSLGDSEIPDQLTLAVTFDTFDDNREDDSDYREVHLSDKCKFTRTRTKDGKWFYAMVKEEQ